MMKERRRSFSRKEWRFMEDYLCTLMDIGLDVFLIADYMMIGTEMT